MKANIVMLGMILLVIPSVLAFNCEQFSGVNKNSCIALNNTNENLIANLIYTNHSNPDFQSIVKYNSKISIPNPPENTSLTSKSYIKNAWINILDANPSILFENQTYVPNQFTVWSEYGYNIQIPTDYNNGRKRAGRTCRIKYSKNSESANLKVYSNNIYKGNNKKTSVDVNSNSLIKSTLDISVSIRYDTYVWNDYCNSNSIYCRCEYKRTDYTSEALTIQDTLNVNYYSKIINANAIITSQYYNTTRGIIEVDNQTNAVLKLDNSSYSIKNFEYYAVFKKKPYYLLQLEAVKQKNSEIKNLFLSDNEFYASSSKSCSITGQNFFYTGTKPCSINLTDNATQITATKATSNLNFLFFGLVFVFILFLIYKSMKKYAGKYFLVIILGLLIIPSVKAEDCGLTNLASCIPEKMYDYFIDILNAPLQPLLTLLQNLLANPPNTSLFSGLWGIVVYCVSIFYSFLIIYSGIQFLFSGHNVVKREMAKEWLKNTVIMMILIQASFYLYNLVLDISSIMTTTILSMVDKHFFQLTADNLTNIGLEFLFTIIYVLILLSVILFLTLRYVVVAMGVIFIPIGIFCYFIPPLKSYGRLILNLLGMLIFITVLDAIVILACSKMLEIAMFQNFKILIMITALLIINILFFILSKHIINKTGLDNGTEKIAEAVKYIGMIG